MALLGLGLLGPELEIDVSDLRMCDEQSRSTRTESAQIQHT
jgi:hypothetical protein